MYHKHKNYKPTNASGQTWMKTLNSLKMGEDVMVMEDMNVEVRNEHTEGVTWCFGVPGVNENRDRHGCSKRCHSWKYII